MVAGIALAEPRQFPDQRHQLMRGATKALGQAFAIEEGKVALGDDFHRRLGRDHAQLRLGSRQRRLDVEPGLPAGVLLEECPDSGVRDPERGRIALLHVCLRADVGDQNSGGTAAVRSTMWP